MDSGRPTRICEPCRSRTGAGDGEETTQEAITRVLRRFRRHLEAGPRAQGDDAVSGREGAEAAAAARSSRPQPLRGRDGEVHRLRAVRGGLPGGLHLRARADNPPDAPVSPGERYGFVYEINYLRCIHCDLCVEACPTEAITESKMFEFSFTNRADAIYTKTRARRRRRRPPPPAPVGGLARGRGRPHLGLDAGDLAVGRGRVRGRGAVVGRARLRRPRRRRAARAAGVTTPPPATSRSALWSGTRSRVVSAGRCTERDATSSPPPRSPTPSRSRSRRSSASSGRSGSSWRATPSTRRSCS